ncbi:MAG: HAMP domain-containing protein [bacterium]|nr:HAMP domain-containing protein [bacterium]
MPRRPLAAAEVRRRRRDWGLAALVGLILIVLIAVERELVFSSRSLPIGSDAVFLALVHVSVILIGLLVFLLARNVIKLVVDRRRGIFGSRLNTKFVVTFVFAATLSSTALFVLSALLVTRAVNVWFELELSQTLSKSVEVADTYYQNQKDEALFFARRIASQIEQKRLLRENALERLSQFVSGKQGEYHLDLVEVFSAQFEELASATDPEVAIVAFESSGSELIRAALAGAEQGVIHRAGSGELVRGAVPIHSTFNESEIVGVVVVNRFLPRGIGEQVAAVRSGMEAYRRLQPSEGTFQGSMLMLLAMITLSSVLFSSWIGFRLAKQVTEPIQRLAGATAEVSAGNLEVRIEQRGDDEIGRLVSAFNRMATDLSASHQDLERRGAQMEVILRSVAAGVLSLDRDHIIQTINPSALRLLGVKPAGWVGRKVGEMLQGHALETLYGLLHRLSTGAQQTLRRQVQLTIADEIRTLNWTASRIEDVEGEAAGFVVVIDDVTQILRVQRMAAWREVARRIAHEIKNPLTPIQLSAQRLRRKLTGRLADDESRQLLEECTGAITSEVDAMKNLLAEFSSFAQLPATDPVPTDLNKLLTDVVSMYRGNVTIQFETELEPSLPLLDLDGEQIKRVVLNLVDNSMASIEEAGDGPRRISFLTRYDRAVGTAQLEVADTGTGVAVEDRARLFEPYYSTKREGSGLGLAIVSRIVSDHSGHIRVRANRPRGSRFIVDLPVRA